MHFLQRHSFFGLDDHFVLEFPLASVLKILPDLVVVFCDRAVLFVRIAVAKNDLSFFAWRGSKMLTMTDFRGSLAPPFFASGTGMAP